MLRLACLLGAVGTPFWGLGCRVAIRAMGPSCLLCSLETFLVLWELPLPFPSLWAPPSWPSTTLGALTPPQPPLPSSKPRSLPCAVSRSHLSSALNDLHALLFSPGALLPVSMTFPSLLGLALPPPLLRSWGGRGKAEARSWMGTRWHLHLLLGAGEGVGRAQGTSTVGQRQFFLAAQHHGVAAGTRREAGRLGLQIGGARGTVQSLLQNCECGFSSQGRVTPSLRSQQWPGVGEGQSKLPGQRMWVPGKDHHPLAQLLWTWRELGCPNSACGAPWPLAQAVPCPVASRG